MIKAEFFALIILLSTCAANCNSEESSEAAEENALRQDEKTYTLIETSEDEFERAISRYEDKTLFDTTAFMKVAGEVKLPIEGKQNASLSFKDKISDTLETENIVYQYIGQFPDIGFYLVRASFWEHDECYLINKETGHLTSLWTKPSLSPQAKYLADLSLAYGLEGLPNGIQLWSLARSSANPQDTVSIRKFLEIDQKSWVPESFVWQSDSTLILKVLSVNDYLVGAGKYQPEDYYFLKLQIGQ
ncbi:hypothetical protein [Croceimicrobium hydrocarbonivorans]|uniref:Uncharacterized protein n=1 Tax=Croceimicrobium hydrocarbonivorans TaxID=2761580 RepID=A0A7H0VD60_9FLAO|nr:hypothetical protein [Croceimicrobium hydrocarbonivorans]QNR23658.1 hypothetical protein H4K34_14940 [Croceimicrobium hydrocarbonivorans]